MKRLLIHLQLTILASFLSSLSFAQLNFPADEEIYIKTEVPRIDILIPPDTLAWIYSNVESDAEFHATFVFRNSHILDTIHAIGFRLRGNTSRYSAKKSFKISFNTIVAGRKYQGVEKMNLNGEHNDPSVCRSGLFWDILRRSGNPGARFNHVQVYINGNYYGLYMNVEHIDEEFVETYFGNNNGNLYKCLYPADLTYKGSNPDNYKFVSGGRRAYDLKTNQEADDYSDLAEFINILNNTPLNDLPCAIEKVFNVQSYLKAAAIDVLTANWDGYIYNKNNFYLYHNSATGLFEYVPYDTDNTFGIDWFGINWATRNIYNWSNTGENRPLYTRLLQIDEYRKDYTFYIKQISNQILKNQAFIGTLDSLRIQLAPYVVTDPYYPLDYGYTLNSFNTSFESGTGAHVPVGIRQFISSRADAALAQCELSDIQPVIGSIALNQPVAFQNCIFTAWADDESLSQVSLLYKINNGEWQELTMHDDGLNGDLTAGDKYYSCSISGLASGSQLNYQVKAVDIFQQTTLKPCEPATYRVPSGNAYGLYINELMASNATTIADEYGEYDDWIEIYNGGPAAVWMGDKYLSDNLSDPQKFAFPDITLNPGAFLLVWADGQPSQGPLHTAYKLNKNGEEIGLFDNAASGFRLLDAIVFGLQATDVSYGRITDGANEWKPFNFPTPGATNSLLSAHFTEIKHLLLYPNPASHETIRLSAKTDFTIYDATGRKMLLANNTDKFDGALLTPGVYFLVTDANYCVRFVITK